jgi:hypothetical protein
MDPHLLDGYFTNLVYEMEASRNRLSEDREEAKLKPQVPANHTLLPWLAVFAAAWCGIVTIGFWL